MNDDSSPLPALEIDSITKMYLTQETVDRVLLTIYEQRSDLFERLVDREVSGKGSRTDAVVLEFYDAFRIALPTTKLPVYSSLFLEARRRVRIMRGLEL
jgi:hypothetical protein